MSRVTCADCQEEGRDGCYRCGLKRPAKNHLPAELASQILEAQPLPEDLRELITILAEECGETVQRCTKILRFGLRRNPWSGQHNRETLERELGDIAAIVWILDSLGVVNWRQIMIYRDEKLRELRKPDGRLLHAKVP